jgi:hypothetical protein
MSVAAIPVFAPATPARRPLEARTLDELRVSLPSDVWLEAELAKSTMFSAHQSSPQERKLAMLSQVGQLMHAMEKLGYATDVARFVASAREGCPFGRLSDPALAGTALILAASRPALTAPRTLGLGHAVWEGLDNRRVDATLLIDIAGNVSVDLRESVRLAGEAEHWISTSPMTHATVPLSRNDDGTYDGILDLGARSLFESITWGVRYAARSGQARVILETQEASALHTHRPVKRMTIVQLPPLGADE